VAILARAYLTNQVISPDGGICARQAPDGIHHGADVLAGLPLTSALP